MNDITYFARTNFRNQNVRFGIKENDRFSHTYIVGKTGVGKTTLLKSKIKQDINNGKGIAVFDPHGDLAESVINMIPKSRQADLVYFDIPNPNLKLGYNPLKRVSLEKRPLVASGLLEAFKKHFGADAWGSDILKLLNNKDFRKNCLDSIQNKSVKDFWTEEYEKYPPFTRQAAIRPIQNKVGAYLSNNVTKRVLVENADDVSFRSAMDSGKIIVINLSKGKIGDDASSLLGGLFLTSMGLSAFSRQDQLESQRIPFFIYCDEFQNFTTSFLVNALSELRKYKIGLVLANQYLDQIKKEIRDAVLGNAGTLIVFRIGVIDARHMVKELEGMFEAEDISHLPNFRFYIRLMTDGISSSGFSAQLE